MSALSSGGAVTQLVAQGMADAVLTGNPQVTFWRFVAKAYTNFALETQDLDFTSGMPQFGQSPKVNLDRVGDLIYYTYLIVDLPGIALVGPTVATKPSDAGARILTNPDDDGNNPEPYWTRAIGQAIIENVAFFIGGQSIDTFSSTFMYIWEELTGQPGKRLVEMTGNYRCELALMTASRQSRRLYIPLPLWYTYNSGLALSLTSLQFHSVSIQLKLRDVKHLIRIPEAALLKGYNMSHVYVRPNFEPEVYDGPGATQPASQLVSIIQNSSLIGAQIEVCYVYLDQKERSKFADGAFEQLIIEHQEASTDLQNAVTVPLGVSSSHKKHNFDLSFNHTVISLFWCARMGVRGAWSGTATTPVSDKFNDWFNFSGPDDVVTKLPIDPVVSIQLKLNNSVRFGETEGRYFRLVQPYQHHTNIPRDHVYTYSFALQPEDVQPSGSCNFSRIDNTQLVITFDRRLFYGPSQAGGSDNNSGVSFMVFATNWNILRFKFGLGGKRFAS